MSDMTPVFFDAATARARGQAHGELWRAEIRSLAELRVELCRSSRGRVDGVVDGVVDAGQVLAVARQHLPVLAAGLPELHDELLGIAEGADLAPEHIVVVNGHPHPASGATSIYLHGDAGPVLGQTWDMHATAEPFVRTVRVRDADGGESICLTLTGCLGIAGIGRGGVAVAVNDLSSTDGGLGILGPALVRAMLAQPSAQAAYELLLRTPLSRGRNYMIADGRDFFGVECSGELKVLTQVGAKAAHLHTNHCFDPVLRSRENVARESSTFDRLNMATTLYVQQRPHDLDGLWRLLGSHDGRPRSICSHLDELGEVPGAARTCGRLAMELATGRMRVASGCSDGEAPVEVTTADRSV